MLVCLWLVLGLLDADKNTDKLSGIQTSKLHTDICFLSLRGSTTQIEMEGSLCNLSPFCESLTVLKDTAVWLRQTASYRK